MIFDDWGIKNSEIKSTEFEQRIKKLYFEIGLDDHEIIQELEKDGYNMIISTLQSIQHCLGLMRCVHNHESIQKIENIVRETVQKELENGCIIGCRQDHIYHFFKIAGLDSKDPMNLTQ